MNSNPIIKARELINYHIVRETWNAGVNKVFDIIFNDNWVNERDLLDRLCNYVGATKTKRVYGNKVTVKIGFYCTHQKYVGGRRYREFGDLIFVVLINPSGPMGKFGYVNAYQFKVGLSYKKVISNLERGQLDFYLRDLSKEILKFWIFKDTDGHIYLQPILIGDFLYYWFIIRNRIGCKVLEIPVSNLWLNKRLKYFRYYMYPGFKRYYTHGLSILINNIFLTSGIWIRKILDFSKPSLRQILENLINYGVEDESKWQQTNGGEYNYDEKPWKPKYQIDGRIIIALEIVISD